MKNSTSFLKGIKAILPITAGIIPFGVIYGITAVSAGIPVFPSMAMSSVIFAGAGQIALVNAFASGASVISAAAIVTLINLRMAMYGASIAPYLKTGNIFKRVLAAYLLTDQAYAVSITEYSTSSKVSRMSFYLGAAGFLWAVWQAATAAGVFLGKTLPGGLSLEFAVPLTFIALMGPFLKNRYFAVTAVVSAAVMAAAGNLPYNTGFFIAVFSGLTAGYLYKRRVRA